MKNKFLNKLIFLIYVLLSQLNFHYKIRSLDIILNKYIKHLVKLHTPSSIFTRSNITIRHITSS